MKTSRIPVFSAYINHQRPPLALGMVISAAMAHKGGILNDCFEFVPGVIKTADDAERAMNGHEPGVLLCSNYVWSSKQNLRVAEYVKQRYPQTVIIHGGPNVPKYEGATESFFAANPCVDVAIFGEGEAT